MRAKKKALILSTALLVVPFSYADNVGLLASPVEQNTPSRAASHVDYLSNRFLLIKEKSAIAEPDSRNEIEGMQSKAPLSNNAPPTGLHWAVGDQRPTLEYRLANQGAIHFHMARRGATAAAAWKF